ncbi:MAG: glycosyltransferase domain-containing protein [Betaproteobacteria bacterium]
MRRVVYTAVTDGYDLHPVINRRDGWDFVCFAESAVRGEGWREIRIGAGDRVVDESISEDRSKTTKRIKILPHVFLPDYDLSIWIDSSLQFKRDVDLDVLAGDFPESRFQMRVRQHPYRRCIYREAETVVELDLDVPKRVARIVARYRHDGFPEDFGLAELNFILRKHHSPTAVAFADAWWAEVRDGSRRDQLSFNYVLWKNPIDVDFIDERVGAEIEALSHGRDRGSFFNSTFNFYPTRHR